MRCLTEKLSDADMIEIGEKLGNDYLIKDISVEATGTLSVEGIIETMKVLYESSESDHNGIRDIIIAHYAGAKFSLLLGTMWKRIIASAGGDVKFLTDDNAVIFEFNST